MRLGEFELGLEHGEDAVAEGLVFDQVGVEAGDGEVGLGEAISTLRMMSMKRGKPRAMAWSWARLAASRREPTSDDEAVWMGHPMLGSVALR
jgi:hypothetical protein